MFVVFQPGDFAHVPQEDETLRKIISEEPHREHFTVVAVQNVCKDHITFLKERFKDWTRQLAYVDVVNNLDICIDMFVCN